MASVIALAQKCLFNVGPTGVLGVYPGLIVVEDLLDGYLVFYEHVSTKGCDGEPIEYRVNYNLLQIFDPHNDPRSNRQRCPHFLHNRISRKHHRWVDFLHGLYTRQERLKRGTLSHGGNCILVELLVKGERVILEVWRV